jgi:hypothetical protein
VPLIAALVDDEVPMPKTWFDDYKSQAIKQPKSLNPQLTFSFPIEADPNTGGTPAIGDTVAIAAFFVRPPPRPAKMTAWATTGQTAPAFCRLKGDYTTPTPRHRASLWQLGFWLWSQ